MNNRTPAAITRAVHWALAGAALATTPTLVNAAEDKAVERIEVTGSRIRKADIETAQPVQVIGRADIEKQGFTSVADILQNLSASGTPPISRAAPLSAGENVGGSSIDLRNLGANRTLVLLNGRRLGVSTSGLQDISNIPVAMIERMEVLKDGASSMYGSDAMAGVINIITRTNYEGAEASLHVGQYSEGDGDNKTFNFVTGFVGEKGSLTAGFEYSDEQGVSAKDRPFGAYPRSDRHPNDNWTTVGEFGGFVTTENTAVPGLPAGTRVVLRPGGDPRNLADYIRQNTNTGNPRTGVEGNPLHKSNTNLQTDLRTPANRKVLGINGVYEFTDELRFKSEAMFANRESSRQVAGYPYQAASFSTPMSAQSYFNPTQANATPSAIGNWWRRGWEVPRVTDSDSTNIRFAGAVEGSFSFADRDFDWDVGGFYSKTEILHSSFGNFNLANVRNAVGPSFLNAGGQVQCGTAAAPIAGCQPWNPFLAYGVTGAGALTGNKALQDYLFQEEHTTGETSTKDISANISGMIAPLPAGDLAFAAGLERREEDGAYTPDALSVSGGSTNLGAKPTFGGYTVDEMYVELDIPVLSDMPGAKELAFNVSSRYSDFDTFGDTTNSKLSLRWKPLDELLVRATFAEGFRAPTIANLYAGGSQTFPNFNDPCDTVYGPASTNSEVRARCANDVVDANTFRQLQQGFVPSTSKRPQTPLPFFSGAANPTLTPETSDSRTLGLVWSPEYLEGFSMVLDYWKVRIENTIVADSPTQILEDCYVQGLASRCTLFSRDRSIGGGIVSSMNYGGRNAGYIETDGFDFDFTQKLTSEFGDFTANLSGTYVSRNEFRTTNDETALPNQDVSFDASYRLRANGNLNWTYDAYSVNWGARYYSAMKEVCVYTSECNQPNYVDPVSDTVVPLNRHGSNTFHDLRFTWSAPWNAKVSVGANNVFDHVGPVMYSAPDANVPYNGSFDIGRMVYMDYKQTF